jgi:hypothetical protein
MGFLFGHLYDSQCKFAHDQAMFRRMASATIAEPKPSPVSPGQESIPDVAAERTASSDRPPVREMATLPSDGTGIANTEVTPRVVRSTAGEQSSAIVADSASEPSHQSTRKRRRSDVESVGASNSPGAVHPDNDGERLPIPTNSMLLHNDRQRAATIVRTISPEDYSEAWKREAFEAALGTNPSDWNGITLVSVSGHQQREEEL